MLRTLPRSLAKSTRQFASVSVEKQPIEVLQTAFNVRLPPQAPLPELATTKLGNGVQVAALETKLPTASLTFAVNASSRFENAENLGVSHFLRLFGYKGVQGRTAFRLAREFDIHGANLHITANREQIFYTAEFLRDELSLVADLVSGIFTSPQFSLHEVEEVRERVQLDLDHLDNNARLFQLVHKAAFRNGLGNSLYAPETSVGEIEQGTLEAFSKKHFVGGNIAVVGSGVDLHDLEGLLGHIGHLPAGKVDASAAKYFGSEVVVGRFDSTSRAAVAYPTAGSDYYKAAIVHHILGGQSRVQYGKGQSLLAKVAGSKASIAAFNATYSDAGLLGFTVSAPQGSGIQGLVEQATAQLKSLSSSVSEADLTRGKNLAKVEYASSLESRTSVAEGLSSQLLAAGQTYSTAAFNAGIDKVTPADIQSFVAKLLQSKATLVAAADDF